jgi:hypothetical protein
MNQRLNQVIVEIRVTLRHSLGVCIKHNTYDAVSFVVLEGMFFCCRGYGSDGDL